MIRDALLLFSAAQAITAAAASTSYLDLGAVRDIGTGEPIYIVVTIDVAFTDSGSDSTLSVDLYGDDTTTFGPDDQDRLFTIPALAAAGNMYIARLNPTAASLQYRYIELFYTPNNGNLSTGSVTAFMCHDIQRFVSYAKGYTIS